VWDVETTGLDPTKDRIVEVAVTVCTPTQIIGHHSSLVNPGMKIPPEASAVHHIVNKHVASAPPIEAVMPTFAKLLQEPPAAYVAHNAATDSSFLSLKRAPWVCTLRLARRLLPDLPKHSNKYLRYALELDVPEDIQAHRALSDTIVTAKLLQYLLPKLPASIKTAEDLRAYAEETVLLTTVNFGKHKGRKWSEVPRDYLTWLSNQPDFKTKDRDLRDTVLFYLGDHGNAPDDEPF
jgi:exodeoxyribonuclease X